MIRREIEDLNGRGKMKREKKKKLLMSGAGMTISWMGLVPWRISYPVTRMFHSHGSYSSTRPRQAVPGNRD